MILNPAIVRLAGRCHRRIDPRSRSRSFSFSKSEQEIYFSLSPGSSRCSFSCHSLFCPAPVRPGCLFLLSPLSPSSRYSLRKPPIDRQSERSPKLKLVTKPIEPSELSGRLTPGQSGWLGAAAESSIPALAPISFSKSALVGSNVHICVLSFSIFMLFSHQIESDPPSVATSLKSLRVQVQRLVSACMGDLV